MTRFSVWVRPLGQTSCRIRVDSCKQANWLLERLGRSFIFKNCEPIREELRSSSCTFQVPYDSRNTRGNLERVLNAIPEVQLMSDPA